MLGFNVFAAETDGDARLLFTSLQQAFVNLRSGRPGRLPPPVADYESRLGPAERAMIAQALSSSAIGSPETVRRDMEAFISRTGADELIVTSQIFDHDARLRSYEIAAELGRR
jgi:alkanesulfonate monooxygenase SsuD/methylene tetrahydromethanopterin reductase-like flavin-dependent oxidoreductase (luciferase family)